jgi:hypothetical protein
MRWLCVAIIGIVLTGNAQAQTARPSTARIPTADAPSAIPPSIEGDLHEIARALQAANSKPESADERRNADAQVKVSDWTPWIFGVAAAESFITAVGVILVALTLYYTKRAAEAARDSAETAERALYELERPILFPETVRLVRSHDALCVGIKIGNYGRMPALLENVTFTLSLTIREKPDVRAAQERMGGRKLDQIIGIGDNLDEMLLPIDPDIESYMGEVRNGILVMRVYTSYHYRSLTGPVFNLSVFHRYVHNEGRMTLETHLETVDGKIWRRTANYPNRS